MTVIDKDAWVTAVSEAGKVAILKSLREKRVYDLARKYSDLSTKKFVSYLYNTLFKRKYYDLINEIFVEYGGFTRNVRILYYFIHHTSNLSTFLEKIDRDITPFKAYIKYRHITEFPRFNKNYEKINNSIKYSIDFASGSVCIKGAKSFMAVLTPVHLYKIDLPSGKKLVRIQYLMFSSSNKVSVALENRGRYKFERAPRILRFMLAMNTDGTVEIRFRGNINTSQVILLSDVLMKALSKLLRFKEYKPLKIFSSTIEFKKEILSMASAVGAIKLIDSNGRGYFILGKKNLPLLPRYSREDVLPHVIKYHQMETKEDLVNKTNIVSATIRLTKINRDRYQSFVEEASSALRQGDKEKYKELCSILESLSLAYFTINFNYGYIKLYSFIKESDYQNNIRNPIIDIAKRSSIIKESKIYEEFVSKYDSY